MTEVTLRIIEATEELHRLKPLWNEHLAAKHGAQYFHTFEWATRNWRAVEKKGGHPFAIVAEERRSPVLVWALQFEKRHGVRSVSALALDRPYYNDAMLWPGQPSQLIEQALQIVRKRFRPDFAWFDMVRPQTHIAATIAGLGAHPMPVPACEVRLSSFGGFDQFYSQLRRGLRKDQRRRRRRLLEQGVVRFEVIRDYPAAADSLDWIIKRKIAWLRRIGGNAKVLMGASFSDFVHNICLDAAQQQRLFVARITLDGNPIAAEAGLLYGQVLSSWLASFDHSFAPFAPGRILMEDCIRWCCNNSIRVYDLLPSEDHYKQEWGTVEKVNSYILPMSTIGHIYTEWRTGRARAWARKNFGISARRQWKFNRR